MCIFSKMISSVFLCYRPLWAWPMAIVIMNGRSHHLAIMVISPKLKSEHHLGQKEKKVCLWLNRFISNQAFLAWFCPQRNTKWADVEPTVLIWSQAWVFSEKTLFNTGLILIISTGLTCMYTHAPKKSTTEQLDSVMYRKSTGILYKIYKELCSVVRKHAPRERGLSPAVCTSKAKKKIVSHHFFSQNWGDHSASFLPDIFPDISNY